MRASALFLLSLSLCCVSLPLVSAFGGLEASYTTVCDPACGEGESCAIVLGKQGCVKAGSVFTSCSSNADCIDSMEGVSLECKGDTNKKCLPSSSNTFCLSSLTCGSRKVCSNFADSVLGLCIGAGSPFSPCTSSSSCNKIPTNAPAGVTMSCTATAGTSGYCLLERPTPSASAEASASAGGSGKSCSSNQDCSREQCISNTCRPFDIPSMDCAVDGVSQCTDEQECRLGICIKKRVQEDCDPPCTTGSVCNKHAKLCVPTDTPPATICNRCPGSHCIVPAFRDQPPVCSSGETCSVNDDCRHGQNCIRGQCVRCGSFCDGGEFAGLLTGLVNSGHFNSSRFKVRNQADARDAIDGDGELEATAGAMFVLDDTLTELHKLRFPPPPPHDGDSEPQAAQVTAGSDVNADLQAPAGSTGGRVILGAAAKFFGAVVVGDAGALTMTLGRANASRTSGDKRTRARLLKLDLQGPLNIVGDSSTVVQFPDADSNITVSGNGQVRVSGGVGLSGDAGRTPIAIEGATSDDQQARVSAGDVLRAAGVILGKEAKFIIRGTLNLTARLVEPALHLYRGARVQITADSDNATFAGDVDFNTDSDSDSDSDGEANIVIQGTVDLFGANVYFGVIHSCPLEAKVTFITAPGMTRDQAIAIGFTVFNYAVDTDTTEWTCSIEVCDKDGCTSVQNPNVATNGRRLLSETAGASFEPTQLTVGYGGEDDDSGAAPTMSGFGMMLSAILLLAGVRMMQI